MKPIILLLYIVISYFLIPYLFSFLGAIKKVETMSQSELSDGNDQLNEKETSQVQKLSAVIFTIGGMYLYGLLGATFGFGTDELVGNSGLKWVIYPLLYIIMVSSFKMGRKVVEKNYEIKFSIKEQVIFYLTMLIVYIMAIWAKESLPIILTWHWIY